MIDARESNLAKIKIIASKMGDLVKNSVFLGGSTVGLLITDSGAPDVRPTMDVDVVVGVKTLGDYHKMENYLRKKGFAQNIEDDVICRWRIAGIIVDFMPPLKTVLGFTNEWYPLAMKTATEFELEPHLKIFLITAPCFIATKLVAFRNRGKKDYALSPDIEDVFNIINGRPEIVREIKLSPSVLKNFLSKEFEALLKREEFLEALRGFLPPDSESQKRFEIIENRIKSFI